MRAARNGIGLVALALGMVACVDATQPTTTGPALYEGANVSMIGTTTVSVPALDGRVVSATTHEWAVDGVVRNGLAEVARSPVTMQPKGPMPVLYISDDNSLAKGRANRREIVSGKDLKGSADAFVFVNADAGPARMMVHVGANQTGAILTPWGAIAAGIAAATAIVYLHRYNSCVHDCLMRTADAGGIATGGFFGSVDLLDPKYFRRGLT
jgi:hypothetical protein